MSYDTSSLKKKAPFVNYRRKSPSLVQNNNKGITYCSAIIVCLGKTSRYFNLTYLISLIVCVNLSSNAAIFKSIADRSLLIDFSNYYRTYLCWQVSSILFSIIQVLRSICLSLISRSKKKNNSTSSVSMQPAFWHNWTVYLSCKKIDLLSLLDLICSSITKIFQSIFT